MPFEEYSYHKTKLLKSVKCTESRWLCQLTINTIGSCACCIGAPEREGTMEQKVPAGGRQSVIPQLAAVQTSCGTARGAGGRRVTEEKTQGWHISLKQ